MSGTTIQPAEPVCSSSQQAVNWRAAASRVYWSNLACITLIHALAIAAFWHTTWDAVLVSVLLWWLLGGVGICLGYHRLLTHRSFQCPLWLEYALAVIGATSWEASPIRWVGQHRLHHAESDQPSDPHTPHHGSVWSHITWMFWHDPPSLDYRRFAKDLLRDPVHRWIDRWARLFNVLVAITLWVAAWALGRDPVAWVLWGVGVRGAVVFHATWAVNSLGHGSGYRNYETGDDSTNNVLVAVATFGEGWHNNHHADQRSARHGHKPRELDLTYLTILLLQRLGLAWDIRQPRSDLKPAVTPEIRMHA